MSRPDLEQFELLILEREALRARGDPRAATYDSRIAALGAAQGLSLEELEGVVVAVLAERAPLPIDLMTGVPVPLRGSYRISRPERVVLYVIPSVLILIVGMMGQALLAGALLVVGVATLALWPRRVTRFFVDDADRLHLGSESTPALDWNDVVRVRVKLRAPRVGMEITRAARARLEIVIQMNDARPHKFARGQFFQTSPVRRPVHLAHVERYLRSAAQAAGLSIAPEEFGFTAVRTP